MNPMILGGHSRCYHNFCILHFFFYHFKLFSDLRDDCMVFAFWIFTFFNWFLKVIFRSMFFPSNSLVKESNIFGVFMEYTCGIRWSMIESAMIFLALNKFFLCNYFSLIFLWNWNLSIYVGVQFIFFKNEWDPILPCLEVVSVTKLVIKLVWLNILK